MLDSKEQNYSPKQAVDKEWLVLMATAKLQGLTTEQVREFLNQKKNNS
ncbi:anti-repressor SinI family protein [Saliterribacillus persicus]|uniref:Anti-repressor SinI n=1 Tax=Saliterribacillus persicus TaxID=930114 RepID=A0A368Y9T9_9BACI|nr:anti-repressor SinI family protein [Saliterribacillus persicus]RCW76972.1 anti-repressor SinI [Saliterribacillus persicus]